MINTLYCSSISLNIYLSRNSFSPLQYNRIWAMFPFLLLIFFVFAEELHLNKGVNLTGCQGSSLRHRLDMILPTSQTGASGRLDLSLSLSVLAYTHPLTVVHYQCGPNRTLSSTLTFSAEVPLQIWVESPCACPNACTLEDLGPGTIFLIILCLSATAYFIFGNSWQLSFNADHAGYYRPVYIGST